MGQNKLKDKNMKSIENIADKMERIVRVMYMATDHLSHRNEIKNNMRTSALSVMAGVIDIASNNVYDSERDLQASVYKTMSFIKIAMSDKSMSDINGQLLLSAYSKLLSFINNISLTDNATITDNIKDIDYGDGVALQTIINTKKKIALPLRGGATQNSNLNNKNERREKILNIIRQKSQNNLDTNGLNINIGCSMSDLLTELTDMNEKMIQRELTVMVTDQIILKRGEKRWSRYVLSHSGPPSVILV